MQKNVASQKLIVFAFTPADGLPKTGDAANITAYVSKDYGSVTVLGDTSATEMDSTNAKGYYLFDLTQAETNADTLLFSAKSSTSGVVVIGVPATVFTSPASWNASVAQTGDTYVLANGASGFVAIKTETAEIDAVTDLLPDAGALTSIASATNMAEANADLDELIVTLGAAAGASLSADIAAIKAETAEIDAVTDLLPNGGALSNLDAAVSTRATPAQILTTALTEAYAADGAAPTLSQAIFQLLSALYEFSISGTTITCKKLDGSTTAMTFTLDDATNPTSRTRAT